MTYTLAEIADLVGGKLQGDAYQQIAGANIIRDAGAGDITFAEKPELAAELAKCAASAAIVPAGFPQTEIATITVENPTEAFAAIVQQFRPPCQASQEGVSPQAVVAHEAMVDPSARIYPGAVIGEQVSIGPRTIVHPGVTVLPGCQIGADCQLFPNVALYEHTEVGDRVIIHSGAVIGAYGFGYNTVDGKHQLSAQLGNVVIEDDVEIGACTTIDRGTFGSTRIGEGTKIDNQVMIAHNCIIGKHNILCSQVGLAGSCTTGDYVVMAGQVGVKDHTHIGTGAQLGAKAGVNCDVGDGEIAVGIPIKPAREAFAIQAALSKLPAMRREFRKLQQQVEKLAAGASPQSEAA